MFSLPDEEEVSFQFQNDVSLQTFSNTGFQDYGNRLTQHTIAKMRDVFFSLQCEVGLSEQESLREFYRGHFCQSPAPPTSIDCKPSSPNLDCIKFAEEIGEINRIVEL